MSLFRAFHINPTQSHINAYNQLISMTIVERLQPFVLKDEPTLLPMQHGRGLAAAPNRPHKPPNVLIPRGRDTLWWCFYITLNGLEKYQETEVSEMLEKRLKIEHIGELKDKSDDLEMATVHTNRIELQTFLRLCAISGKGIFYVDEQHKTYSLHSDDNTYAAIIVSIGDGRYGVDLGGSEIQYRNTYLLVDRAKPLKAIGAYKAAELTEMVAKLGVPAPTKKKRTKAENYEILRQRMGV
jgi:hypothetical protein